MQKIFNKSPRIFLSKKDSQGPPQSSLKLAWNIFHYLIYLKSLQKLSTPRRVCGFIFPHRDCSKIEPLVIMNISAFCSVLWCLQRQDKSIYNDDEKANNDSVFAHFSCGHFLAWEGTVVWIKSCSFSIYYIKQLHNKFQSWSSTQSSKMLLSDLFSSSAMLCNAIKQSIKKESTVTSRWSQKPSTNHDFDKWIGPEASSTRSSRSSFFSD